MKRLNQAILAIFLGILPILAGHAIAAEDEEKREPRNSVGLDHELGRGELKLQAGEAAGDDDVAPMSVRIAAAWRILEPVAGRYDFSALDAAVEVARSSGARIILNIHGAHPEHTGGREALSPSDEEAIESWTGLLRAVATRYSGRTWAWQVGRHPERAAVGGDPDQAARDFAFFYKRSAVAIRSVEPEARVALPTVSPAASGFLSVLFEEEIAPYSDAVSASFDGTDRDREGLTVLSGLLLVHDPSAALWVNGVQVLVGLQGYGQILRGWSAAMEREAFLVTFDEPADSQGRPFHMPAIQNVRKLFTSGYAPLVESGRGVRALTASGESLPGGRVTRFFDGDSKSVLMVYDGGRAPAPGEFGVFVLDTVDLSGPVLHDLAAGESAPNVALQKDEASGLTRAALPLAAYPLVLSYKRFTTPEYAQEGENLDVTGERIPIAEEIIARYQAVQEAQDALLENVRAEADEEWHFTAGASGSFDIRFESSFYFDPSIGAEWEQKKIYLNGVRWRSNSIPEFPFVNPEKAVSLPLIVTLSKSYAYRYEKREEVNGFDCHVISFKPVEGEESLSSGRVWIDAKSYARVHITQTLDTQPAPLISNEQRDTYTPVIGPDGFRYWILSRIDSERVYSVGGRNLPVTTESRLSGFIINGPEFQQRREEAMASSHTILRDTERGMRYLKRNSDGTRTVKEDPSTMNLFAVGGVLANRSLPFPVPLAGINYFEGDLGGRGIQSNVFFAGALLFGNLSDPDWFGTPLEANLDVVGIAVAGTDRLVRDVQDPNIGHLVERENEEITTRTQSMTLGLGLPFWKFFKLKGEGRLAHVDYSRTDETCNAFVSPRDTWLRTGTLTAQYNRRAWSVELDHQWAHRTRHEPWGLDGSTSTGCPRPGGGTLPPDFFPEAKDYVRYSGTLAKNFFLPSNQKILLRLTGRGSRDLDRFSKYRVSFFGNRIRGFSGGGIHYTNGGVARLDYAFSLGEVIRLGAGVDQARIRDRQQLEPFRSFTGAGLFTQFAAPWNLLIRIDYGIAVASDIPQFRGEQEILVTVLKLFSQR